jgi:transportin-3
MISWTASDKDEFRDFRHDMGDCLKDSVTVIGEKDALIIPLTILANTLQTGDHQRWQDFEAPLFCIRSMVCPFFLIIRVGKYQRMRVKLFLN